MPKYIWQTAENLDAAKIKIADLFSHPTGGRPPRLTVQENAVLRALVLTGTNKGAANVVGISCRTIEIHRANIIKKHGNAYLAAFRAGVRAHAVWLEEKAAQEAIEAVEREAEDVRWAPPEAPLDEAWGSIDH